jgi:hypothetical protein
MCAVAPTSRSESLRNEDGADVPMSARLCRAA